MHFLQVPADGPNTQSEQQELECLSVRCVLWNNKTQAVKVVHAVPRSGQLIL